MKNSIFLFFFLILINTTTFSNGTIPSKGIKTIEIKGQYINLNIIPYAGENIILNQLSDKKNSIIKNNITKDTLQYNLSNEKKNSFFKTKIKFDLLIPQNSNFRYLIKTTNSSISVNGINGIFSIDNTKGKITINNLVGTLEVMNSNKDIKLSNIVGDIYVKGLFSRVITENTLGVLNIKTTDRKIKIKNAEKVGSISTSNASISAEFQNIISGSKIVTSNHSLTIKIPEKHNFNFSIFGDLIHVKNEFPHLKTNKFLILGTSNGTIKIEKK